MHFKVIFLLVAVVLSVIAANPEEKSDGKLVLFKFSKNKI